MIKFMNFMNQWDFMHVWMKFPKIRSYMHEFPFVHKIHKFDHGDDLVIMAMTGCWSCMKISFRAVFMAPKPKAKFVEIWLNVFDAGVWRLSSRRGVWGLPRQKCPPLKYANDFAPKNHFLNLLRLRYSPWKSIQKNMCNIPWKAQKVPYSPQYSC